MYTIAFFIILFFFFFKRRTKQNSYCSLHIHFCTYNCVFPGLECRFLSAQQTSAYQARPILLLLNMGTLSRAQQVRFIALSSALPLRLLQAQLWHLTQLFMQEAVSAGFSPSLSLQPRSPFHTCLFILAFIYLSNIYSVPA